MRLLNDYVIEVIVLNDFFKEIPIKDKDGNIIGMKNKVTKKGIETRMPMSRFQCWPSEYLNFNGTVSKKKMIVWDNERKQSYIAKGNYDQAMELLLRENKTVVKGYGK